MGGESRVSGENRKGGWVVGDSGVMGGGCLGERSVDRFQAWYFPDRLNGKGQRLAALVSYERDAVCVRECVFVSVFLCVFFVIMCDSKICVCLLNIMLKLLLQICRHAEPCKCVCVCVYSFIVTNFKCDNCIINIQFVGQIPIHL